MFSWRQTEGVELRDINAANYHLSQLWVWFQKLCVAASISMIPGSSRLSFKEPLSSLCLSGGVCRTASPQLRHPGIQGIHTVQRCRAAKPYRKSTASELKQLKNHADINYR